jgi:hypothetical protein
MSSSASLALNSDTETLQEQTIIAKSRSESLHPWLVVLATFIVLVVGLGAGTAW